jgi:hypothetical protein
MKNVTVSREHIAILGFRLFVFQRRRFIVAYRPQFVMTIPSSLITATTRLSWSLEELSCGELDGNLL